MYTHGWGGGHALHAAQRPHHDAPPLAGLRGQASDIAIQAEQHVYTKRRMAELTTQHSGKPFEQIRAASERDRWFTADQVARSQSRGVDLGTEPLGVGCGLVTAAGA